MKTRGGTRACRRLFIRFGRQRRTATEMQSGLLSSTSFSRSISGLLRRGVGCCRGGTRSPRVFAEADHVGKNAVGAGYAFGHLAIESVRVIDVHAFSVLRVDQASLLWSLSGIMGFNERHIRGIPAF